MFVFHMNLPLGLKCLIVALALWNCIEVNRLDGQEISFNEEIRPILTEHCYACHGPDAETRAADLRLDNRDALLTSGVIEEDDFSHSELLLRILQTDPEAVMPPPETHKPLSDNQIDLIQKWILEGARYQEHWAFVAPIKPELPSVSDKSWPRQPIDHLVLANLEQNHLRPAPEADLTRLVRRVTLDLTGLPPTVEQLQSVLSDDSTDRYERYVDQLLSSERWGEHRGRFWLDYARYADTHGIHFDNYREIWSYRDWVINAFNRNMPFDQFTTEQIAGDLLPNRTLDQQIATGFNRCNITTNEGGIIDEEYLVLYTRDRTETISQIWLGLTTGCAVCHDHKFDPISQEEFYQLAAFFNNSVQKARDGNVKDTPPIVQVPRTEDRARFAKLEKLIADKSNSAQQHRQAARVDFERWLNSDNSTLQFKSEQPINIGGLMAHFPLDDGPTADTKSKTSDTPGNGRLRYSVDGLIQSKPFSSTSTWADGIVADKAWVIAPSQNLQWGNIGDFDNTDSFTITMWVKLTDKNQNGALIAKMDESNQYRGWDVWLENNRVGAHIIHAWKENALKTVAVKPLTLNQWHHVAVRYDGSQEIDGLTIVIDGKEVATKAQATKLSGTIRNTVPLKLGSRSRSPGPAGAHIQDLRIHASAVSSAELAELKLQSRALYLMTLGKDCSKEETEELFDYYVNRFDKQYQRIASELAALNKERLDVGKRGTIAHVYQEKKTPAEAFVLFRGEYDQRRKRVTPETPAVLPKMNEQLPKNRLGLAKWLLDENHPLTARVTVNRFWQEIFGTGLVETSGDFGVTGAVPTNQALLDYLAVEFQQDAWDIKRFFRRIVTSSTYRQSSHVTQEKLAKDPNNKLLSRGSRYRLDAEVIRDYALHVSGLLGDQIGGKSVRPYQPPGVWEAVAMPGSDTRDYRVAKGQDLYRRSMYTFWKRAAPPASMEILNAPNREVCTVRRERTNTPIQALVTLNDPQFIESARVLASSVLESFPTSEADNDQSNLDARLDKLAVTLLAREFTDSEKRILNSNVFQLRGYYEANTDDAAALVNVGESPVNEKLIVAELAAWTMLVNQLLNLDEVLCK